jgi:hypothetical protein
MEDRGLRAGKGGRINTEDAKKNMEGAETDYPTQIEMDFQEAA